MSISSKKQRNLCFFREGSFKPSTSIQCAVPIAWEYLTNTRHQQLFTMLIGSLTKVKLEMTIDFKRLRSNIVRMDVYTFIISLHTWHAGNPTKYINNLLMFTLVGKDTSVRQFTECRQIAQYKGWFRIARGRIGLLYYYIIFAKLDSIS